MNEADVREALRGHLFATQGGVRGVVDELWMPLSNERADIAVIGGCMHGFEIKSERDTLKRLPRQMLAYGRLFDRCTAVVAERHRPRAEKTVPEWWGVMTVHFRDGIEFATVREAQSNSAVQPEILVRLLWRSEALGALRALGHEPNRNSPRGALWADLLRVAALPQLKALVRSALLSRDPLLARMPTRRYASPAVVPGL